MNYPDFHYRGFTGSCEQSYNDENYWHGRVNNDENLGSYFATSREKLEETFHRIVDHLIDHGHYKWR